MKQVLWTSLAVVALILAGEASSWNYTDGPHGERILAILEVGDPPVVNPPVHQPTVFDTNGIFFWKTNEHGFDIPSGYSWVAIQVNDRGVIHNPAIQLFVNIWRFYGYKVGGWGINHTDPVGDARDASDAIREYGLDFYIADAEAEYKASEGGWERSARFVSEYRRLRPSFPSALSSLGGSPEPWVMDINYKPWQEANFDFLPQAYWNDYLEYEPGSVLSHARRAGFNPLRVHLTYGLYPGHRGTIPLSTYLLQPKTIGYSVFRAEFL